MPNSRVTGQMSPGYLVRVHVPTHQGLSWVWLALFQVLSNLQIRQVGAFAILTMLLFLLAL